MITNQIMNLLLAGFTKNAPTNSTSKRIISFRERYLTNRSSNQSGRNQECSQIPKGRSDAKSCGHCKEKGHTKMKCQRLLQDFGIHLVPLTDMAQRKKMLIV